MQDGHVNDLPAPTNVNHANIFTSKVSDVAARTRYHIKEAVCIALSIIGANHEYILPARTIFGKKQKDTFDMPFASDIPKWHITILALSCQQV